MADYATLVEKVLERSKLRITTPVCYSSIRRGINKVIEQINNNAEILEDDTYKFRGEISIALEQETSAGKVYLLTYHPNGRELPDCFKPKFEFNIVESEDENTSGSLGQNQEG